MYSFYGGRPGNSFIIVKTFPSKDVMIENFKKGPLYQDVHYDEYVLINTQNKMDETNGQIYRRGYNYNSEEGGAEYIGTIVGPQGNAPHLVLTTPQIVEGKKTGGQYSAVENSVTEGNLIPGKDGNTYNDTIKWVSVSIRDNNGEQSSAYVGLTIPYPVFEFETESINAYTNLSVDKTDDGNHPFYHKWKLNIPKGIKGDSIENIRIITYQSGFNVLGIPENFGGNKQIFVGDVRNYDGSAEGQTTTYYLGQYDVLKDLTLDDDGTLTKSYTNSPSQILDNKIKWIDSITLDNDGILTVTYNDNSTQSDLQPIKWINSVGLNDDGTLTINYNRGDSTAFSNRIKWIDSIDLADNGTLTVKYNNDTADDEFDQKIKWIKEIKMSEDDSALTFVWNNNSETQFTDIKWLSDISLSADGLLRVKNNTDGKQSDGKIINPTTTIEYPNGDKVSSYDHIKWIEDMVLDTSTGSLKVTWNYRDGEDGDVQEFPDVISQITDMKINSEENLAENQNEEDIGKLAYQINNGEYQSIGQPINYIKEVALNDNNQMLVRYSDPSKNGNIEWGNATDWTSVGDFTTNFQLSLNQLNDTFVNEHWTGIGEIVETEDVEGYSAHIDFTIAPSYFLAQYLTCQINSIELTVQEINPQSGKDRSFSNLILKRAQSEGTYTDYLILTGQDNDVTIDGTQLTYGQETIIPVEEVITLNITPAGIHFQLRLDKNNLTGIGRANVTSYPHSASDATAIGNAFCYISVSQLGVSFNRTDLSGSSQDEPKPFNGKYLEYIWDSRRGWQSAMTEDLLDNAKNEDDIVEFNSRRTDTEKGYKTYSMDGDFQGKRALAIKLYRQWHGENGTFTDDGCFFIDLVKPEPLRRRGVHIVNIQTLWFESSLPIMVYTRTPGASNPLYSYVEGKSDSRLGRFNQETLAAKLAASARPELECIKYGQNQYFRIIVRNPEGSSRTSRNLHIVLRFMYYIDDSNMD